MSRLLQAPVVVADARPLAAPDPAFDPAVTAALEEAYRRGRAEGEAAGHAAGVASAADEARRAVGGLHAALQQTVAACQAVRRRESDEVVALAEAMARVVVGHEPSSAAQALLSRVRDALHAIDDPTVMVAANPADVAALDAGLADVVGLDVHADESLAPGEARVVGRWANAELTRAAAWDAIHEMLSDIDAVAAGDAT